MDVFRMRGYYQIEEVRNLQTKQYTRDVHRLSNSRRVLNSAYRSRNTADSLKTVNTPNVRCSISDVVMLWTSEWEFYIQMSYRTRDTIRDRFDEVDSLNSRLNRLLNRPDIDEMNDKIEVKKNTKWNYGLSVSKNRLY